MGKKRLLWQLPAQEAAASVGCIAQIVNEVEVLGIP